jgi:hypothetical protein
MYTLPKAKARPKNEPRFEVQGPDGTVFDLPLLQYLPPKIALRLSGTDTAAAGMLLLFTEYAPKLLDQIEDNSQLTALFEAWQVESGITAGE